MRATISWQGRVKFVAESGTGHQVVLDGPADHGGANQGPRPIEMELMGMGGCASRDVMTVLKKSGQEVTDCRCERTEERAGAVPAVLAKIHFHFVVTGGDV